VLGLTVEELAVEGEDVSEDTELSEDDSLAAGGVGAEALQSEDISSLAFPWDGSTGGFCAPHAATASTERRANPRMRLVYHQSERPAIAEKTWPMRP
jgi:hypothetical protein